MQQSLVLLVFSAICLAIVPAIPGALIPTSVSAVNVNGTLTCGSLTCRNGSITCSIQQLTVNNGTNITTIEKCSNGQGIVLDQKNTTKANPNPNEQINIISHTTIGTGGINSTDASAIFGEIQKLEETFFDRMQSWFTPFWFF